MNELPADLISSAEQKLVGFHEMKSEFDGRLQRVFDDLANLKQMLRDNAYSKKTQAGYLTQRLEEYQACLELKHVELEGLFREDELTWAKHIDAVKGKAQGVKDKLKAFFEKQNEELAAIMA